MSERIWVGLAVVMALAMAASADESDAAAHWPHWRGPTANGMAAGNAPVEFGDATNLAWRVEIPGRGFSTPVVWGNRMFLTTAVPRESRPDAEPGTEEFHGGGGAQAPQSFEVMCLDRMTGETIWRHTANEATPHEGYHKSYGSFASSSPVTDGKHLYVSFGSFGLYCYDLDGTLVWKTDFGVEMHMRRQFGEGSTPALHGDTLVLLFDQEEQSFIVAVDAKTGEHRWRDDRDEPSTWATPLITEVDGRMQVVTSGSTSVRSYDLATGEIIWTCRGLGLNAIPSPLRHEDTVLVMTGYRDPNLMCIRLGGSGDLTGSDDVLWNMSKGTSYTCQPVLHDGKLYAVMDRGFISCFDVKTGEAHYLQERLPRGSNFKSSPVGANGRLYLASESGEVHVIKMGPQYEVVRTNTLTDQFFVASPVIVDGKLYLRSREALYCFNE